MKKHSIIPLLILCCFCNLRVQAQLATCNTSGILAKWDFNSNEIACNGATNNHYGNPMTPRFQANKYFYCPNTNAGCGMGLLGSKGHLNTNFFTKAICLANFWSSNFADNNRFAPFWDPNSTTWDAEHPVNLYVQYKMPAGKTSCLNSFSLQIVKKQFDGTNVPFEKQGLAVKRNGVLIYSQAQALLPSHINVNPMTFNFSGAEFCSDGSSEVTYELIFGLVHRYEDKEATGYDNITVNGTCGSPPFHAAATSATCTVTGAANNGKITLSNFKTTDRYQYTAGNTYTGTANFATATAIPTDGILTTTLSNPATPQSYTIRVFNSEGCFSDATVLLLPALCMSACLQPSGEVVTAQSATCNGAIANSDAQIRVSGVTNADKIGISTGSTYTGANYATAANLTLGAYTFSGLTNPTGMRIYTLRLFNGSDDCYIDRNMELLETPCAPCASAVSEIKNSSAADPNSTPNNQVTGEDDQTVLTICRGTQQIDLELNQTVTPATEQTCPTNTPFTWTLTLQNTGNLTATDIQIGSILPEGLYALSLECEWR